MRALKQTFFADDKRLLIIYFRWGKTHIFSTPNIDLVCAGESINGVQIASAAFRQELGKLFCRRTFGLPNFLVPPDRLVGPRGATYCDSIIELSLKKLMILNLSLALEFSELEAAIRRLPVNH